MRQRYYLAFVEFSRKNYVYVNLEDYNPAKKKALSIVFDDMIADMKSNKIKFCCYLIIFKRKKTQYFTCF